MPVPVPVPRSLPRCAAALLLAGAVSATLAAPASAAAGDYTVFSTDVPPYERFHVVAQDALGNARAGDVPLICNVDSGAPHLPRGDDDYPVAFRDGRWLLQDLDGTRTTFFGRAGDEPLCLDVAGDHEDELALKRGNQYFIASSYENGGGSVTSFRFGRASDVPLVGDWDGDGDQEIGLKRGNVYFFASENVDGGGRVVTSSYGRADDVALAGRFTSADVTGQTWDSLAVRRGQRVFVTGDKPGGRLRTDTAFSFGRASDIPAAGALSIGPTEQIGLFRAER